MPNRRAELLETAYDLAIPPSEWLVRLCEPAHEIHAKAVGTWVFEFDRRNGTPALGGHCATSPELIEQLQSSFERVPAHEHEVFFNTPLLVGTARGLFADHGLPFAGSATERAYEAIGYRDTLGMAAFDPVGVGVSVGIGFAEVLAPSPGERRAWMQIAAHLAAAHRLRRKLAGGAVIEHAAAVISPSGRLEHAEDGFVDPSLRAQLAEAVERVEYARGRARDLEEALSLWRSLVAGEWSLADHFEGSGRRYYVAIRNPPEIASHRALTRREAEVVAYLARGTKTQAVAYALGIDEVTVRGYLKTALAKLGLRTRAELIEVHAMLRAQRDRASSDDPR